MLTMTFHKLQVLTLVSFAAMDILVLRQRLQMKPVMAEHKNGGARLPLCQH